MNTAARDTAQSKSPLATTRDTIRLVRADFASRQVDTIASLTVPQPQQNVYRDGSNGRTLATRQIKPFPEAADEWAVLADGSVGSVRANDYHVDWVSSSGVHSSGGKLPFDWVRVSERDKQTRVDSMKKVIDSLKLLGRPFGHVVRYRQGATGQSRGDTIIPTLEFVPMSQVPEYLPSLRAGAAKADQDGNLWILPSTSAEVGAGLVYDVVNSRGDLFQRVRIPPESVLAGFGRAGVVYTARPDRTAMKWTLSKGHIVQ